MRPNTSFMLACALASAAALSVPATAADLNNPYIHRETSGSWTNVEYNDGVCHYYFSHNAYDNQTNLNKYGDCSHIAIGPNGAAMPVAVAPMPYGETYGYGSEGDND